MRRSAVLGLVLVVALLSARPANAQLTGDQAFGMVKSCAATGFVAGTERLFTSGSFKEAGKEALGAFAAQGALELVAHGRDIFNYLTKLAGLTDDEYAAAALVHLGDHVKDEPEVSQKKFEAMFAAVQQQMAAFTAAQKNVEYRLDELSRQARGNATDIALNQRMIEYAAQAHEQLKKDFKHAMGEIDISLNKIDVRMSKLESALASETRERERQNALTESRLAIAEGRISRIEYAISPETRATTAAMLGSDGALMIINEEDPIEAAKLLKLAIAYDKLAQEHVDPGARYFLAVAYHRLGKNDSAEEMLAEAVVAERFRLVPPWFETVAERFQGPDRQWLESRRTDPRFGVRAPREVITIKAIK